MLKATNKLHFKIKGPIFCCQNVIVQKLTLDSNVQECRDFDEVVAVDEQEHVQPHVSPTQEASRSILTQHPGKHRC